MIVKGGCFPQQRRTQFDPPDLAGAVFHVAVKLPDGEASLASSGRPVADI